MRPKDPEMRPHSLPAGEGPRRSSTTQAQSGWIAACSLERLLRRGSDGWPVPRRARTSGRWRMWSFSDLRKPEDLRIEPGAYVQVAYEQRDMVQIERVRNLLNRAWFESGS